MDGDHARGVLALLAHARSGCHSVTTSEMAGSIASVQRLANASARLGAAAPSGLPRRSAPRGAPSRPLVGRRRSPPGSRDSPRGTPLRAARRPSPRCRAVVTHPRWGREARRVQPRRPRSVRAPGQSSKRPRRGQPGVRAVVPGPVGDPLPGTRPCTSGAAADSGTSAMAAAAARRRFDRSTERPARGITRHAPSAQQGR